MALRHCFAARHDHVVRLQPESTRIVHDDLRIGAERAIPGLDRTIGSGRALRPAKGLVALAGLHDHLRSRHPRRPIVRSAVDRGDPCQRAGGHPRQRAFDHARATARCSMSSNGDSRCCSPPSTRCGCRRVRHPLRYAIELFRHRGPAGACCRPTSPSSSRSPRADRRPPAAPAARLPDPQARRVRVRVRIPRRRPMASRRKIVVFIGFVLITVVVLGTVMYVVEGPENGLHQHPGRDLLGHHDDDHRRLRGHHAEDGPGARHLIALVHDADGVGHCWPSPTGIVTAEMTAVTGSRDR